jgi:uncharacterized membrane-anchored protein YitT (DUF2179 family)
MFTLVAMYVSAMTVDKVIAGFNTKKTVLIVSECSEQIAAAIMNEVGRGVTFVKGQGAFTREDKKLVFVVVSLTQIAKIKPIVDGIDPHALMIVQDAVEVLGTGLRCRSTGCGITDRSGCFNGGRGVRRFGVSRGR